MNREKRDQTVGVRTTKTIRELLNKLAERNGWSLGDQIEHMVTKEAKRMKL